MTAGSGTALYRDLRRIVKRNAARITLIAIPTIALGLACFGLDQITVTRTGGTVWPFSPQPNLLVTVLEACVDLMAFVGGIVLIFVMGAAITEFFTWLWEKAEW